MLAEAAESRRDAADPQRRHAGRQRLPAPVVLVLPQRLPVLQGGRQPVLLVRRREPVPRHLRRRSELHRPSVGHGAGAGGARRDVPHHRTRRRSHACRRRSSSRCRGRTRRTENVLADDEVLTAVQIPAARPGTRSTYHKVMDREAWTHAVVSAAVVLEMDQDVVPQRPHRARRRRADSVAAAGGGEGAGRTADHRRRRCRRRARSRSPAPVRCRRTPTRCR